MEQQRLAVIAVVRYNAEHAKRRAKKVAMMVTNVITWVASIKNSKWSTKNAKVMKLAY